MATSTWTDLAPATTPGARRRCGMAYDTTRNETVMEGGQFVSPSSWAFDSTDWTQDATEPTDEGSSWHSRCVAYDPVREETVAFGGSDGFGGENNATWIRDNTGTWAQASPTHAPSARQGSRMAWCSAISKIVLFGGFNAPTFFDETWTWDGTDWTELSPSTTPAGRYQPGLCSYGTGVLMFGGSDTSSGTSFLDDTWEFDGTDWEQQTVTAQPTERAEPGMALYESQSKVILYGGVTNPSFHAIGDTWSYNGDWLQESPAVSPPSLYGSACSAEPVLDGVLLFGGDGGAGGGADERDKTWLFTYETVAEPEVKAINHAFGLG